MTLLQESRYLIKQLIDPHIGRSKVILGTKCRHTVCLSSLIMKQQLTNFVLLANRHYDKSFSASAQPQRDPNTSPKVNWLSTDNLNRIFSFGENNANAIYEDPD